MKLGLVIDLDTCVGCHACAVACKQWNTSGTTGPLTDERPYSRHPEGVWFNRVRAYEAEEAEEVEGAANTTPEVVGGRAVYFPMSCMHCEDAACVDVCPTGASYKRAEDGIVLVDQDKCMGCNLCAWACPYGARELDTVDGTMKKCTLCVDRIYDENLPESERQPACVTTCPTNSRVFGDFDDPDSAVSKLTRERNGNGLLPELGYKPVNQYLPPRTPINIVLDNTPAASSSDEQHTTPPAGGVMAWINKILPQ